VNSGAWRLSSSVLLIFMNMLRANRLCQAFSVTMRMGSGNRIGAGIAILHEHVAVLQEPLHPGEQRAELIAAEGRLYSPHQTCSWVECSWTMNLSAAARAVVLAGADDHRAEMRDARLAAEHDLFIERRGGQVQ